MWENQSCFLEAAPATRPQRLGGSPLWSATRKQDISLVVVWRNDSRCRRPPIGRELARKVGALADARGRIARDVERRYRIERTIAPGRVGTRLLERYPGKEGEQTGPERARDHQ